MKGHVLTLFEDGLAATAGVVLPPTPRVLYVIEGEIEVATSFIRVSILPREIQGKSSIVYVDPAHASVKPRRYTVFVDAPIDLHGGPLRLSPYPPDARRSNP